MNPKPEIRSKLYVGVATVVGVLVVLGVVNADDVDVNAVVDALGKLAAVGALILARTNVSK